MSHLLSQLVDFLAAHQMLAILFAFLVAFGEALLILGLFVPSTPVLVGLGTLIGLGKMAFLPVFAATVAGAIAGDALSFWAGVRWKEQIRTFWSFSRYTALMDIGEQFMSDVSAHGTVLRDCVAEGLRFIFTPDGVEDDEETRDNEGPCRAGCEGHPARDAQIAFF